MGMNVIWVPEDIPGPADLAERFAGVCGPIAYGNSINFEQEGLASFTRVTTTIAVHVILMRACAWIIVVAMRRGDFR